MLDHERKETPLHFVSFLCLPEIMAGVTRFPNCVVFRSILFFVIKKLEQRII